ncbi:MAG: hypothetical protein AMXMBFR7_05290 [Planctomycetota bacterium]
MPSLLRLVCRSCQHRYEVTAAQAAGKPRCPQCGASNAAATSAKRLTPAKRTPAKPTRGSKDATAGYRSEETVHPPRLGSGPDGRKAGSATRPGRRPTGSQPPEPEFRPAPSYIPEELGPYRILQEIGRGGVGVVLKGRDGALRREVAVKTLREDGAADEPMRLRFIAEAQITGQLEHPGIAPVYFLGRGGDGIEFFAMRLVEGTGFDKILNRWHSHDLETREEYPLPRLISIFERICETVGFAHSRRVIHRDLKPGNIMIGHHGEVWVLDWGLAKVLDEDDPETHAPHEAPSAGVASIRGDLGEALTIQGHTVGTPEYMSPEQARGETLDARTDIYSLGAILYHMLTGDPPIRGETLEETVNNAARGTVRPVRRTPGGRHAPPALAAICERCLARDAEKRYRTANGLLRDLRHYQAGETVSALPESAADRFKRFARRHRLGLAVAGSVCGLVLVVVTVASALVARKDRLALRAIEQLREQEVRTEAAENAQVKAEAAAQQAKLERQAALVAQAERGQRRARAFVPYGEAMNLLLRGVAPDRAAEALREALRQDAEFPEAQHALGEALRLSGNPKDSAEAFLRADELNRKLTGQPNLQALVAAGFAFDGAGYYTEAQTAFQRAEKLGADHPLALVGRALALSYDRRLREAMEVAKRAQALGPHFWEAHLTVGYILIESDGEGLFPHGSNRQAARDALQRAHDLAPRQAETCIWLATALEAEDPPDRAGADRLQEQAIVLEPKNGCRYAFRALTLMRRGNLPEATDYLKRGRALGLSNLQSKMAEAVLAARSGDERASYACLKELQESGSLFPSQMANLFISAINLDCFDEVEKDYERWVASYPTYSWTYGLQGHLLKKKGLKQEAKQKFLEGLKQAPYHATLLQWLANLHIELGETKDALEVAQRACEAAPKQPKPQILKMIALAWLKRNAEATALRDEILARFPDQREVVESFAKRIGLSASGK